jgi:hypothetical protein
MRLSDIRWRHFGTLFFKLSSKNTKSAVNAGTLKAPRTPKCQGKPSCFLQTSKYLLCVLSASYMTSCQCYQNNIFLIALPFISYHAAIPGWVVISVQYKNKSHRGTRIYLWVKGTLQQHTDKVLINNCDAFPPPPPPLQACTEGDPATGAAAVGLIYLLGLTTCVRADGKYWWMGGGAFGNGNNIGRLQVLKIILNLKFVCYE